MNTKISDAAVEAACVSVYVDYGICSAEQKTECREEMRAALAAALPHLAADAVPVGYANIHQLNNMRNDAFVLRRKDGDPFFTAPLYTYPQPAALNEVPTMDDAVAAGDGTLHGAIDHWQYRVLKAEAALNEVSGNSGELGGDERARYDAWRASLPTKLVDDCDEPYEMPVGGGSWEAWQAALAATGKHQGGEVQGELIAKKVGDYRVTVAEDTITVSHEREVVFAYSAGDSEPIVRQTVGLEPEPYGTWINHEQEPHCCGCYVIHWNSGFPLARCNECGHRKELLSLLANSTPRAQGVNLSTIATRKLAGLAAQGYVTNGVAIFNPATGHRGLVDNPGFVGWMGGKRDAGAGVDRGD